MKQKIEAIDLDAIQCPSHKSREIFSSSAVPGLQLMVKDNGRKEFHLRYTRPSNKARTSVGLGLYPSDIPNLETAYEVAKQQKSLVKQGIDPSLNKRFIQNKKRSDQYIASVGVEEKYRFSKIASNFLHQKEKTTKKGTIVKYRQGINNYLLGEYGSIDIRFFDYLNYELFIFNIAEHSRSVAMNTHSTARAMFSYAVAKELINANPLTGKKDLVRRIKVEPNVEFFSPQELHRFLNELDKEALNDDDKLALKIQIHTGLRIGEILSMEWDKIDFRTRKIVHDDTKTGQIYTIMSDKVRRLLLEWKRDTVNRNSNRVFVDGLTTLRIIDDLKKIKSWMKIRTHKLRKTVRTYLQELGCPKEIRDLITNHKQPEGVARHYDHSKMDKAQLHWLELWAEKLDEVQKSSSALQAGIDVSEDDKLLVEFKDIL